MTVLRFNIEADKLGPNEIAELAEALKSELNKEDALGPSEVEPIRQGRSGIELAAGLAVAIPLVIEGAKALDAVLGVIERLKKLIPLSKGTKEVCGKLDPEKIFVDVDGILVPLTKLSEEHLERLREGGS